MSGSAGPLWPIYELMAATRRLQLADGKVQTGFQIRHEGRDYLITAAHGMPKGEERVDLLIGRHEGLGTQHVELTRIDDLDDVNREDVAIFSLAPQTGYLPAELMQQRSIGLGQDIMILGYPFGRAYPVEIGGRTYSTPMVKRGCLAAIGDVMHLDLVANPGFSGAPVFFHDPERGGTAIAGMIKQTGTLAADDGKSGVPSAYADISGGSWASDIGRRLAASQRGGLAL